MPLFHHKSEEEKRQAGSDKSRQAELAAEEQATQAALARGDIPPRARRRFEELREAPNPLFTSNLSVSEFALTKQTGMRPIAQVMGSSIYHVGWQGTPYYSSGELGVISNALNAARKLAVGRLYHEAEALGAHAVVGCKIVRAKYDWGGDLVDFNVMGTAVRESGTHTGPISLSNLSVQDFWKLRQAGYEPCGLVGASTVYYIIGGWQLQLYSGPFSRWGNQEMTQLTRELNTGRHMALQHLYHEANQHNAHGLVAVDLEQDEEEHEVSLGNDQERTDLIATYHALATAIVEKSPNSRVPVHIAVDLRR